MTYTLTPTDKGWAAWYKRCGPCNPATAVFCGDCTDPTGSKGECRCFVFEALHRELWNLPSEGEYKDDPDYDGIPTSRALVDRWEAEKWQHEDAI
jgi:hypothetical protein